MLIDLGSSLNISPLSLLEVIGITRGKVVGHSVFGGSFTLVYVNLDLIFGRPSIHSNNCTIHVPSVPQSYLEIQES